MNETKSQGSFIPIKKAVETYEADVTGATLLLAAEDLDDPDWRDRNAKEVRGIIESPLKICRRVAASEAEERSKMDSWILLPYLEEYLRSAPRFYVYMFMRDSTLSSS